MQEVVHSILTANSTDDAQKCFGTLKLYLANVTAAVCLTVYRVLTDDSQILKFDDEKYRKLWVRCYFMQTTVLNLLCRAQFSNPKFVEQVRKAKNADKLLLFVVRWRTFTQLAW